MGDLTKSRRGFHQFDAIQLLCRSSASFAITKRQTASTGMHFPTSASHGVMGNGSFTPTTYPLGSFPTSDFTFSVPQPPCPSDHSVLLWPPAILLHPPRYIDHKKLTEYNPSFALDATYEQFPLVSLGFSYSSFAQVAPHQRGALHPVQPTASGSNPQTGVRPARRRPDNDSAAATQQQPSRKRRKVQSTAKNTSSSTSSTLTSSPTPSLSSASSSSGSSSSSSTPSIQPSTNWIQDPDGRFRCLLCTAESVYADTEKDIVRHLDTAEAHHPAKVRCGDTIYRCPCSKGLLGKRLDAQKRHVRGYITSERKRAIKLEDGRRLYDVNAYEVRLKSEKLL